MPHRSRLLIALSCVIASLAALTIFAACGGDDDPAPTATVVAPQTPAATASPSAPSSPAASSTPAGTPAACPVDAALCDLAQTVEAALTQQNLDPIIGTATGQPVTCSGAPAGSGIDVTQPLCAGAPAGEVRSGFRFSGYQSEGSSVDLASLRGRLATVVAGIDAAATDVRGGGALRAHTIGCVVAGGAPNCDDVFAIGLSGIARQGGRGVLTLVYDRSGAAPELVAVYAGVAVLNRELIDGGDHDIGIPYNDPATRPVRYVLLPR